MYPASEWAKCPGHNEVPSFADPEQLGLSACGHLFGYQTEPRRELTVLLQLGNSYQMEPRKN